MIQIFHHTKENGRNLNKNNASISLSILFVPHNSEEIKVACKSNYNKCKNQVILLIISDEANNCYYLAVKNLSELKSLQWLMGKKEAIIIASFLPINIRKQI